MPWDTLFRWDDGFWGVWGVHPITTHDDGTFQIAEDGDEALIFPTEPGDIFDTVAWYPTMSSRWWTSHSLADFMNEGAILRAIALREPLYVYQTPLDLLRASGRGTVILDARADVRRAFAGVREIHAANMVLGRQIQSQLREPAPPSVLVPEELAA